MLICSICMRFPVMVFPKLCECWWCGPPSLNASLSNYHGDDHGGFQENKLHLQQHISLEFLKLHQFLHSKEKDLLSELREEGKALNEEMELNLSHIQEQCLLAKEMLVSIQARMEQQNPFDFLKVRLHTNMTMGTTEGGREGWKECTSRFSLPGGEKNLL